MLRDYQRAEYKTIVEYSIDFTDEYGDGFSFPCDAAGELLPGLAQCARDNYAHCLAHKDDFVVHGFVSHKRRVKENASGTCICGNRVELWDEYRGACECEQCGRWYNLFGQELLPPEQWEDDEDY